MPKFETTARYAAAGCLLKPVLHEFFQRDVSLDLHIRFTRVMDRPYDGWFHSSVHPLQPEYNLWLYLAHPGRVKREPLGYVGSMSTMFGTITGELLKEALRQAGIAIRVPEGDCPACGLPQPSKCSEHGAADEATISRGHLDDIADFKGLGTYGIDWKTIRPYGLKEAPDMDAEFFREKWPHYWAQGQDYMRLTGLRKFIFFFLGLGNPWEMREYHIEYDPVFCFEVEAKYKRALQLYREGRDHPDFVPWA